MDKNNNHSEFHNVAQNQSNISLTLSMIITEEQLTMIADRISSHIALKAVNSDSRLSDKAYLTMREASEFFGIGQQKLRELAELNPECFLMNGNKKMVKKERFQQMLDRSFII